MYINVEKIFVDYDSRELVLVDSENPIFSWSVQSDSNGGRFGAYETLVSKGTPRGGFPWDNVFVSSNIKIVNAEPVYEPWMKDHAIFVADLEIN